MSEELLSYPGFALFEKAVSQIDTEDKPIYIAANKVIHVRRGELDKDCILYAHPFIFTYIGFYEGLQCRNSQELRNR